MTPFKFLCTVFDIQSKGIKGYFCVSTKSVSTQKWRDNLFQWPQEKNDLGDFLKEHPSKKYDLYFCPVPFKGPQRNREDALPSRLLWADLDEAQPKKCDPVPQIVWRSSPGRYASLWYMNQKLRGKSLEQVNRNLTYASGADKSGWDLTQVLRVPNTINHKYPKKPVGKLLWFKTNKYPLSKFPDEAPNPTLDAGEVLRQVKSKIKPSTYRLLTKKRATKGSRSDVIWKLENLLSEQGVGFDEIFTLIKSSVWNKFSGRRDEDGQLRRELQKVEARAQRPQLADIDEVDEKPIDKIINCKNIKAEKINWLWYPYIAKGKLTLLEGDPGLGKSWLVIGLCSLLSRGKKLPMQTAPSGKQTVLIMTSEDGIGDTIVPRIESCKGHKRYFNVIEQPMNFGEDGIDEVQECVEALKPDILVIDPILAYLGTGVDMNKASETRPVLSRLHLMAQEFNMAVIGIRHLTKSTHDNPMMRGQGSVDFVAVSRSLLMVMKHPEDDKRRLLTHAKCNIAPMGKTVEYIIDFENKPAFKFGDFIDMTATEIAHATKENHKNNAAGGGTTKETVKTFLEEALADGPVPLRDIKEQAEIQSISWSLVEKVQRDEGIVKVMRRGVKMWELP